MVHIRLEKHPRHGHLFALAYESSPDDRQAFIWPGDNDNKVLLSLSLAQAESAVSLGIKFLELLTGHNFKKIRDDDRCTVYEREDTTKLESLSS